MPRAKDTLKIDVTETTTADTRHIAVTITAPAQEFLLTDLLRQRGAVGSVEVPIKQAVKDAIQGYLETTEELVAGIATGQKKANGGAKLKTKTVMEKSAAEAGNGAGTNAQGELLEYEPQARQSGAAGDVLMLQ